MKLYLFGDKSKLLVKKMVKIIDIKKLVFIDVVLKGISIDSNDG